VVPKSEKANTRRWPLPQKAVTDPAQITPRESTATVMYAPGCADNLILSEKMSMIYPKESRSRCSGRYHSFTNIGARH